MPSSADSARNSRKWAALRKANSMARVGVGQDGLGELLVEVLDGKGGVDEGVQDIGVLVEVDVGVVAGSFDEVDDL